VFTCQQEDAMQDPSEPERDGKLDLVPMIDCVMLMLLFFILTTSFLSEDKQIAALLPSHGQGSIDAVPAPLPPPEIHLVVVPSGLAPGLDQRGHQDAWERLQRMRGAAPITADLRVGGSEPLVLAGGLFASDDPPALQRRIDAVHAYVQRELAAREQPGDGQAQAPVNIHCFSGLSWGYALVVYDAVRAYEAGRRPSPAAGSSVFDDRQRTVSFAPPRIRDHTSRELGQELWELRNLR
jgi:hypothetical protein